MGTPQPENIPTRRGGREQFDQMIADAYQDESIIR